MRKQTNRERSSFAGPSFWPGERSSEQRKSVTRSRKTAGVVAGAHDGSNLGRDRGAVPSLLDRLKAENAELRNSVVALALEIHTMRERHMRERPHSTVRELRFRGLP